MRNVSVRANVAKAFDYELNIMTDDFFNAVVVRLANFSRFDVANQTVLLAEGLEHFALELNGFSIEVREARGDELRHGVSLVSGSKAELL